MKHEQNQLRLLSFSHERLFASILPQDFGYLLQQSNAFIFSNSWRVCEFSSYNPLVPSAHKSVRIAKISILKLKGIIKKISYERRDYESVDEKGLS